MGGYIGARAGSLSITTVANAQDITATDTTPEVTIINNTHEDTDGGREGKVIFKGQQSGGEESTLAEIQGSHDGTADDEKGDLIFKTNDGSDGTSPTERLRIDSNGSILTATLGTDNVHLGEGAGDSITSGGNYNVAIGKDAGTALTTGDNNVAVGIDALKATTTSNHNVAIGKGALESNLTGEKNIAIGSAALDANTVGDENVAIGNSALGALNPAGNANMWNTAVGSDAGKTVTTGVQNTLIGAFAGGNATTIDHTVCIGVSAGGNATMTGHDNNYIGYSAGGATTSGQQNVAIGRQSLEDLTSATNSTAGGHLSLANVTTGNNNTAFGSHAGFSVTSERNNVFVGSGAGYSTTGAGNCFFGGYGSANGVGSGYYMTTGDDNVIIGGYTGNNDGVDIRSGSNYIVLSDGNGSVRQVYWAGDGRMYMRQTLSPWASGSYNLGVASNKWAAVHATNGTIQTSDENEKQQIASLTSAEITAATAISKLFKTYKMNDSVKAKGDAARTHTGVIAQQVEAAMTDAGLDASKYGFWCSDTWWSKDREVEAVEADEERGVAAQEAYTFTDKWEKEEDAPEGATKHTVLGMRYDELLAFVCAATEQRLTSIESRLTALEGE